MVEVLTVAVSCPLCSSKETSLISNKVRFDNKADVLRCEKCSLVFLDQNSFQLPSDFYENEYHQTYLTHIEPALLDPHDYFEKMLISNKLWIRKINSMLTGEEVILDFGCSTGHLIKAIQSKAKKVYGHELNRKEVEFCRNIKGLDVDSEPLHNRFSLGMFDYITMIFVLEHIAEPITLLSYLKNFLKPTGKLLILVPNAQDALLKFYDIPEFKHFYYCIEHLFYYTPNTIKEVFKQAGLKGNIDTIQEYPITNHLNWGYRQKPADTLASRRSIPDIPLACADMDYKWEEFWLSINQQYKQFLQKNNYGDRIWCEVGLNKESV